MFLLKNVDCNIDEDQEEVVSVKCLNSCVQPKFFKQLNFVQNAHRWRERRIRERRKVVQIRSAINEKLKLMMETQKKDPLKLDAVNQGISPNFAEYKGHQILGKYKKKLLHGETQIIYSSGVKFDGVFKNGKMQSGCFDFENGFHYRGELEGRQFMGKGTLEFPDKRKITGVWNNCQIIGRAQIQYPSGDLYYGEVKDLKKHGEGYLFFRSGNKYVGEFKQGQIDGKGSYFENDQMVAFGIWKGEELIKPLQAESETKRDENPPCTPSITVDTCFYADYEYSNYQKTQTVSQSVFTLACSSLSETQSDTENYSEQSQSSNPTE